MEKFLFISRHEPNAKQVELAQEQGIELISVGDLDAFSPDLQDQIDLHILSHKAKGVVAVHPLVAVNAKEMGLRFGSFRNVNRAPVGEKPQFDTDLFVVL